MNINNGQLLLRMRRGQGAMCIPSIMSGLESPDIDLAALSMYNLVERTRHDDSVLTEIDIPLVIRNVLRVLPSFPIRLDPDIAPSASRTTILESGIEQADEAFFLLAKMAEHYTESEPNLAVSTIVSSDGIPLLVDIFRVLSVQTSHLLEIRMKVVRNIARIISIMAEAETRDEGIFRAFRDAGIVPCLVEAIKVPSRDGFSEICTRAAEIIDYLARESDVWLAFILDKGVANPLLQLVATVPEISCKEAALGAIDALLSSSGFPCCDVIDGEGLDILIKAFGGDHEAPTGRVQFLALQCIRRLIVPGDRQPSRRNEVIRLGLVPHLIRKLKDWPGYVIEILQMLAEETGLPHDEVAGMNRRATIVNEGAVLPLVQQLTSYAISRDSYGAMGTIDVLRELACSNAHSKMILLTLRTQRVSAQTLVELAAQTDRRPDRSLQNRLRPAAASRLASAVHGTKFEEIEDALKEAEIAGVDGATLDSARDRVADLARLGDQLSKALSSRLDEFVDLLAESKDGMCDEWIKEYVLFLPPFLQTGPMERRRKAAVVVKALSGRENDIQDAMFEAGVIKPLVALLAGGAESEEAESAAHALANLAWENFTRSIAIVDAGGITPLVALLAYRAESAAVAKAACALAYIAEVSFGDDGEACRTIVEAGGIAPLLALLADGEYQERRRWAARALAKLARDSEWDGACPAIAEAGGIQVLVGLLAGGAKSEAAYLEDTADTLMSLSHNCEERSHMIVEAGGIQALVEMLSDYKSLKHSESYMVSRALDNLAHASEARSTAIVEAGGIQVLVGLLARYWHHQSTRAESVLAETVAHVLTNMAMSLDDHGAAVLSSLRNKGIVPSQLAQMAVCELQHALRPVAKSLLADAAKGTDRARLEEALAEAALAAVKDSERTAARERFDARARRESVGLGSVSSTPDEFVCPITFEVMVHPVVASDGHTYERSAIEAVLRSGNKKSPITREELTGALVPNRALRQRIAKHEDEIDQMVKIFEARMAEARSAAEASLRQQRQTVPCKRKANEPANDEPKPKEPAKAQKTSSSQERGDAGGC